MSTRAWERHLREMEAEALRDDDDALAREADYQCWLHEKNEQAERALRQAIRFCDWDEDTLPPPG